MLASFSIIDKRIVILSSGENDWYPLQTKGSTYNKNSQNSFKKLTCIASKIKTLSLLAAE